MKLREELEQLESIAQSGPSQEEQTAINKLNELRGQIASVDDQIVCTILVFVQYRSMLCIFSILYLVSTV